MSPADDPHLVERIARLAAFHDLPAPVIVEMVVLAAEVKRLPVGAVYAEVQARIEQLRKDQSRAEAATRGVRPRPALRLVGGEDSGDDTPSGRP